MPHHEAFNMARYPHQAAALCLRIPGWILILVGSWFGVPMVWFPANDEVKAVGWAWMLLVFVGLGLFAIAGKIQGKKFLRED